MSKPGSAQVTDEQLHAYLDGELDEKERAVVDAELAANPQRRAELEQVEFVGGGVRASLEMEADSVPAARFEQIWDQIDTALDREARLQEHADAEGSLWSRLVTMLRPVRIPLAVAGAAAAAALLVFGAGDPANTDRGVASVDTEPLEPEGLEPTKTPSPMATDPDQIAQAPEEVDVGPLPDPESNDAEIRRVEFGGKAGRISKIDGAKGTTTVIWISEEEPIDSERPL